MKALTLLSLTIVTVLAGASSAVADPYVIRPTSAITLDFDGGVLNYEGSNFLVGPAASLNVALFSIARTSNPSCDPCSLGDIFDPGFHTDGEVKLAEGSGQFGGETYPGLTIFGTLDFDAMPVSFPAGQGGGFLLQTLFTFNGFIRGVVGGQDVFAGAFTGTGRALRFFDRLADGRYAAGGNHQLFVFDAAADAAPVPEPATMLLVGTGVAMAAARRRRKRVM